MKKNYIIALLLIIIYSQGITAFAQNRRSDKAKYVFLFIGDGMGMGQVSSAETYLAAQKGIIGSEPLSFTKFPVMGMVATYSADSYITCSSAAGTALSTGFKTNNLMLGVDPDTNKLTSISYKIHKKGIPVGILTTVTIDHATPGAFYANNADRNDYYSIATQIPLTGFEFFGGGGFLQPNGEKGDKTNAYKLLEEGGYAVVRGLNNIESKKDNKKVALFQETGKETELPFAIDRQEGDLALKDIVSAAIDHLYSKKGFFIMAEGGKIDWAAHSNDAKSTILEILDFADAIEVAYQFYLRHPHETLIVVTSDHDAGGMSIGREKGYKLNLKALDSQKSSFAVYNSNSLTHDENDIATYQGYSKAAYIGWTTTSHLGNAVPVFSTGVGSQNFSGRMDNTEIPRKILKVMDIEF
ncbi:MAG: alkaline phosphatase [Bacteroidales bacterium]